MPILIAAVCASKAAAQNGLRFSPAVDYATGTNPVSVAAGDLNGDGKLDLVAASQGTGGVTVLFGDGSGTFPNRIDLATGMGPHCVAIADLNQDGRPDLVVTNYASNNVAILSNLGGGAFAQPVYLSAGSNPFWVSVADLNGDGSPDLAVANNQSNTVSIWLGSPSGTFGSPLTYATAAGPSCIAVGDFNGDGKPDLAVACVGFGGVSILYGLGFGGFGNRVDVPTGSATWGVVAGDLNGDGHPDLAVTNHDSNNVSILLGNGQGSFTAAGVLPTPPGPRTLGIGDLNGDGRLDLVVPSDATNLASVFLGNGSGQFANRFDLAVGSVPYTALIADLNGDTFADIVSANVVSNTVSVILQQNPGVPTSCAMTASPNPSVWGQPVTLTATVTPATATGTVSFTDGQAQIISAPLANGVASVNVSLLAPGSHSLFANYSGDANNAPSISAAFIQVVGQASTTTSMASSPNPSSYLETVLFTATVSVTPPGAGHPQGGVQFKVDNVNVGGAVTPDASGVARTTITTMTVGDHAVKASYSGDDDFAGSDSPTVTHTVTSPAPTIVAVRDVPNDQGGHVFITWHSPLDHPGAQVVTGYRVWRRAPNPGAAAARRASAGMTVTTRPDGATLEGYWESIATLPAEQLLNYAYDAPTTQDSIAGSNPLTAFFVTALTADAFVFFPSPPDSGYSVDNLAPPTPAPFAGSYMIGSTALHWGANPAPDLREYRLYRGLGPQFVPGPDNLVIATRDTGYVDVTPTAYVYKLDAIDIHGNPSHYAVVTPNGPVATLASLVSIDASAHRISLGWYSAGNAGLAVTIYRRTPSTDWSALRQAAFDGTGFLRFDDTSVQTGTTYGYRLGIMDGGLETFVAEAWATAEVPEVALEGARPNPAVAGAVKVAFTLTSAEQARLELIDVGGRLVAVRDVGALGPGPHTVDLEDGGRVPPGVYLIRLTAASRTFTRRVAVLP